MKLIKNIPEKISNNNKIEILEKENLHLINLLKKLEIEINEIKNISQYPKNSSNNDLLTLFEKLKYHLNLDNKLSPEFITNYIIENFNKPTYIKSTNSNNLQTQIISLQKEIDQLNKEVSYSIK